jgi:hypothetical protein
MYDYRTSVGLNTYFIDICNPKNVVLVYIQSYSLRFTLNADLLPESLGHRDSPHNPTFFTYRDGKIITSKGSCLGEGNEFDLREITVADDVLQAFKPAIDALVQVSSEPGFPKELKAKIPSAYAALGVESRGVKR